MYPEHSMHPNGIDPILIPKVFHFVWFGGPVPEYLEQYVMTWKEHHDQWAFNLWTEDMFGELFNQDLFDRAAEIAPDSVGQFKSDIVRYEILARYGGVYVDCDFECLQPIDELLHGIQCFAAWEVVGRWVNNAIMGAIPDHPLMEACVEALPASVAARRPNDRPNRFSGPQFLTTVINAEGGATIFPQAWFYPYAHNELHRGDDEFPDAYAVHHWDNQRKKHAHPRHIRA